MRFSFGLLLTGICIAYIIHAVWTIYKVCNPPSCPPTKRCLKPAWNEKTKLQVFLCTSLKPSIYSINDLSLLWSASDFVFSPQEIFVNVSLPRSTVRNGSLYLHAFAMIQEGMPKSFAAVVNNRHTSHSGAALTKYAAPRSAGYNLLDNQVVNNEKPKTKKKVKERPIAHWRPTMTVNFLEPHSLYPEAVPGEVLPLIQQARAGEYLPVIYISEVTQRLKDLMVINSSTPIMPLAISLSSTSLGRLRLIAIMEQVTSTIESFGFVEKDIDDVRGLFFDVNLYVLLLTVTVTLFHILFDILAIKNDILYWKQKKNMVGISSNTVMWRCFSQAVIFAYLFDQNSSNLVLIPAGAATLLEIWKLFKALKLRITFNGLKPTFHFGETTQAERETEGYDNQIMRFLFYLLIPLCIGGAIYSLLYTTHKSWYSWCIQSLANGVYAFGFLFMLPQLFVNYKLKSVAHLPWRAFMYKAFNTVIDDLFAFIITMPTAHRVACFRDDVVFVIYLYQRWLYPVDKTRIEDVTDGTVIKKKEQ